MCFPATGADVAAAVRVIARHDRAFVARGSGTGLAGGATPVERPVVIVTTHLNRIVDVDVTDRIAWVEPGVLNLDLSRAVAPPGPALRARSVVAGRVLDRRQRRDERRRAALPGLRRDRRARGRGRGRARRRLGRGPRRRRARPARLRPAGLLRRERGDDGHRPAHRRAAHPEPAGRAHPPPRLHRDRRRRRDRQRRSSAPGSCRPRSR